jgi:hypothetical protein
VSVSLEKPAEPSVPDQSRELTASAVFDLLSNNRRRCVIHFLLEEPESTVRELSRHVAAWEYDVKLSDVTGKQRKRVYTGLHQTHLPRLDDYGVLEYDSNRGDVRGTERLEVFEPYLDSGQSNETGWHVYYLGLGVATTGCGAGGVLGLPVISAVPPFLAILLGGSVLTTIAVVHAGLVTEDDDQPTYPDLQPSRPADRAPTGD